MLRFNEDKIDRLKSRVANNCERSYFGLPVDSNPNNFMLPPALSSYAIRPMLTKPMVWNLNKAKSETLTFDIISVGTALQLAN